MLGLGLHIRKNIGRGRRGLLNKFPDAAVAYSLRELSTDWKGQPVVRIRRDIDNAEANFTMNEILDGELLAWVYGASSLTALNTLPADHGLGAEAAFSLRHVSSYYSGDVVRVRRSIDNTEGDFNPTEITDGTLENWAFGNPSSTLPADHDGGAEAAYSLRQVSSSYGGPVIRVRRSSDNAEADFTSNQITNGTLESWVFETASSTLPADHDSGAEAAYSLRQVSSSYGGPVIRVRRSSDNTEMDFTTAEITNGTLETWVSIDSSTLPADHDGGAEVAYSLRQVSSSYSGDVVRVRRSLDNAEADFNPTEIADGTLEDWVFGNSSILPTDHATTELSLSLRYINNSFKLSNLPVVRIRRTSDNAEANFTPTEITDGTLIAWTGVADGKVVTWFNQSDITNDAYQGTAGSQPALVNNGMLITENGLPAIETNGINTYLLLTSPITIANTISSVIVDKRNSSGAVGAVVSSNSVLTDHIYSVWHYSNNYIFIKRDDAAYRIDVTDSSSNQSIYFGMADTSSHVIAKSGEVLASTLFGGAPTQDFFFVFRRSNSGGTQYSHSKCQEIILSGSDLTPYRRGIEKNQADYYSITYDATGVDAHVTTWYDQSSNAHNATQGIVGNQPILIAGGTFYTIDGYKTLYFNGTSTSLQPSLSIPVSEYAFHIVSKNVVNPVDGRYIFDAELGRLLLTSEDASAADGPPYDKIAYYDTTTGWVLGPLNNANSNVTTYSLLSGNGNIFENGISITSGGYTPTPIDGDIAIGARFTGLTSFYEGRISEFILYVNPDGDKRPLIEKNQADYYEINYVSEDGYVTSWYDQSGNAYNAIQSTAASQPIIVKDRILITDNGVPAIEFNSSYLTVPSSQATFKFLHDGTHSFVGFVARPGNSVNPDATYPFVGNCGSTSVNIGIDFRFDDRAFLPIPRNNGLVGSIAGSGAGQFVANIYDEDFINPNEISILAYDIDVTNPTDSEKLKMYVNGVKSIDSISLNPPSSSNATFNFDVGSNGAATFLLTGSFQELVIYNTDQSNNMLAIGLNQSAYYSVTYNATDPDAYVTTWYDQSGASHNMTRATATSQPKIVNSGVMITDNGKPALQFDGINDYLSITDWLGTIDNMYISSVSKSTGPNDLGLDFQWIIGKGYFIDNSNYRCSFFHRYHVDGIQYGYNIEYIGAPTGTYSSTPTSDFVGQQLLMTSTFDVSASAGENIQVYAQGTNEANGGTTTPINDNNDLIAIGGWPPNTNFLKGTIQEIIFYTTDQSSNRIPIEKNQADYYSITYDATGIDAFVATWYDQSLNVNNVTQGSASSQPKLVVSGVLSVEDGLPIIDFHRDQLSLVFESNLSLTDQTIYIAYSGNEILQEDAAQIILYREPYPIRIIGLGNISIRFTNESIGWASVETGGGLIRGVAYTSNPIPSGKNLLSFKLDTSNFGATELRRNSESLAISVSTDGNFNISGYPNSYESIGRSLTGSFQEKLFEVIIYSNVDNIGNIEANINQYYHVVDVNGYVTTWYDQSGTLRDAIQGTGANQPILVNSGIITTTNNLPAITFDGVGTYLVANNSTVVNSTTDMSSFIFTDTTGGARHAQKGADTGTLAGDWFLYNSGFGINGSWGSDTSGPGKHLMCSIYDSTIGSNGKIRNYKNNVNTFADNPQGTAISDGDGYLVGTAYAVNTDPIWIGRRDYVSPLSHEGTISEWILWRNNQETNRDKISENINNFYSIF